MDDYKSIFYSYVIRLLKNVKPRLDENEKDGIKYWLTYEPQDDDGYRHNYLRNNFISDRDRLITCQQNDNYVILLRENRFDKRVVVYKEVVNYLFNDKQALKGLISSLREFYTVELQDRSRLGKVDFSNSVSSNTRYIYDIK